MRAIITLPIRPKVAQTTEKKKKIVSASRKCKILLILGLV